MGIKVAHLFITGMNHEFSEDVEFSFSEKAKLYISVNKNMITERLKESVWKEWIGSIKWNSLKGANAILELRKESPSEEIQDSANEALLNQAYIAWGALKLLAPIHTEDVYQTSGYFRDGKIHINHFDSLSHWILPDYPYEIKRMNEELVEKWKVLYQSMDSIRGRIASGECLRVWRGLRSFEKASNEYYLEFRLPFFVRSIEALILPDIGKTTKQFKSRASRWWKKEFEKTFSADVQTTLAEIYDMRCDFDHLHGMKDNYTKKQQLRGYQSEQLARHAFQSILMNQEVLRHFKNDATIKELWARPQTSMVL